MWYLDWFGADVNHAADHFSSLVPGVNGIIASPAHQHSNTYFHLNAHIKLKQKTVEISNWTAFIFLAKMLLMMIILATGLKVSSY